MAWGTFRALTPLANCRSRATASSWSVISRRPPRGLIEARFVARDAGVRLVLGVLLLEDEEALTAAVVGDKKIPLKGAALYLRVSFCAIP